MLTSNDDGSHTTVSVRNNWLALSLEEDICGCVKRGECEAHNEIVLSWR